MYQLIRSIDSVAPQVVVRTADGAFIPPDPANTDFAAYLAWLEEGNEPLPDPEERPYTWEQAIAKRDNLLMASDWTMTPGVTVNQHDWAVYRQILRDIPQTFKGLDPLQIIWPEKPSTAGPNTRAAQISAKLTEEAAAAVETSESLEEEEVAVKIDEEQTEV